MDFSGDTIGRSSAIGPSIDKEGRVLHPNWHYPIESPRPIHPEVLAKLDDIYPMGFDEKMGTGGLSPNAEARRHQIEEELGITRQSESGRIHEEEEETEEPDDELAHLRAAVEELAESSDDIRPQFEQ